MSISRGAETRTRRPHGAPPWLLVAVTTVGLSLVLHACGGSSESATSDTATSDPSAAATSTTDGGPSTTTAADYEATAADFPNLADMTPVRGFFVDNLLGDLPATLEVANSTDGGTYPVGTLLQLVPGEAMVKRAPGFSPGTNDWEFFELGVSDQGTVIRVRGGNEVVNRFGGSCADCHAAADPQYDFVCEQDHGCEPLPIGRPVIEAIQESDPRPRSAG